MALGEGDDVAGYRLTHVLGEGGMGHVWAADRGGKSFALKFLADEPADLDAARKRMLREARAAQSVEHPHVVSVQEVLELDDGAPVIVMELLSGESLADRIARDKPLSVEDFASIILPVVSAVGAAHARGVVHRDLKPANIFLTDEGVRVLDFGIAKRVAADSEDTAITASGAMLGTPCYMAPEQAFGEKDIDDRADVWALGIIAYESLSGLLPTKADNVGQVLKIVLTRKIWPLADAAPDVPEQIANVVDRMLSRERSERPTMRELFDVLRDHTDVEVPQIEAPQVRRTDPAIVEPPDERSGLPWRWAALAAIATTALVWWQLRPTAASAPPRAPTMTEPSMAATTRPPAPEPSTAAETPVPIVSSPSPAPTASASTRPTRPRPKATGAEFDPLKQRR